MHQSYFLLKSKGKNTATYFFPSDPNGKIHLPDFFPFKSKVKRTRTLPLFPSNLEGKIQTYFHLSKKQKPYFPLSKKKLIFPSYLKGRKNMFSPQIKPYFPLNKKKLIFPSNPKGRKKHVFPLNPKRKYPKTPNIQSGKKYLIYPLNKIKKRKRNKNLQNPHFFPLIPRKAAAPNLYTTNPSYLPKHLKTIIRGRGRGVGGGRRRYLLHEPLHIDLSVSSPRNL